MDLHRGPLIRVALLLLSERTVQRLLSSHSLEQLSMPSPSSPTLFCPGRRTSYQPSSGSCPPCCKFPSYAYKEAGGWNGKVVSSRPRSRGVSTGLVSVFFWRFPVGLGPHCGLVGFWTGAHQMFASLVVPRPRDMFASCFDPNARLSAPFCSDNDWRGQPANSPNPVLGVASRAKNSLIFQKALETRRLRHTALSLASRILACRGRSRRLTGARLARGSSPPRMWSAGIRGTEPGSTLTDVTRLTTATRMRGPRCSPGSARRSRWHAVRPG